MGRLKVWDLEILDENNSFDTVHSVQFSNCSGYLGVLLIQQTLDCNGVVVLTESLEQNEPWVYDVPELLRESLRPIYYSKGYNLGVVQFNLDGPDARSEPICKTWGAFTGNDTIALEGQYVAAEHQGTTRVWDWKRNLFSAYHWDLSLHPQDQGDEADRVSKSFQVSNR
jgi:hypothetical protein